MKKGKRELKKFFNDWKKDKKAKPIRFQCVIWKLNGPQIIFDYKTGKKHLYFKYNGKIKTYGKTRKKN